MMQRLFVGAADIHAGTRPDGLQSLQNLNILRRIVAFGRGAAVK